MRISKLSYFFAAAALLSTPAWAQKSQDTLRIAISDPFSVLDNYHFPQDEVGYLSRTIYSSLLVYDEHNGKFVPELAKSWTRINPTTIEYDLRDDVVFHTGNKFTSDDVKHTMDYLRDPKTNIRFKNRYEWVKSVEKLGPYKVRITSGQPLALDQSMMAYHIRIYDSTVHKSLDNPADYGRVSTSTTGPYRMISLDRSKGVVMERFDGFFGSTHRRSPIKRIHGLWIPDRQTQIAQLLTGGVDVLRNITADSASEIKGRPGLAVTPTSSKQLLYVTLDAAGRSASKVFTDIRVRKAFIKAVNRGEIVKNIIAGGETAEIPRSICFKTTTGCAPTTDPLAYDPDGARKLLAEAGLADGFELNLQVFAPIKEIAEAIAGNLRKVGIRATVEPLTLSVYVKKRGAGEFTAFAGTYPTTSQPDVDNLLEFFFGENRDYYNDPITHEAYRKGSVEFDLAKRTKFYTPALDRVNEMAYIFPLSELPLVYAHTAEVRIDKNLLSAGETRLGDFFWK